MFKHSILAILLFVLVLGVFFQFNMADGYTIFVKNTNELSTGKMHKTSDVPVSSMPEIELYHIIYDPQSESSIELLNNISKTLEYMKKKVKVLSNQEFVNDQSTANNLVLTLDSIENEDMLEELLEQVKQGAFLYIMSRPDINSVLEKHLNAMGISSCSEYIDNSGMKFLSNIFIQGKGLIFDEEWLATSSLNVKLNQDVKVHLTSNNDNPLLWETKYGLGRIIFYNGTDLTEKVNRGLITGVLGVGKETYLYPIANFKSLNIDDFPAPISSIASPDFLAEYNMSLPQFYRQIWWPDLLKAANINNFIFTTAYIVTYNNQVNSPYSMDDPSFKEYMKIFGREILKSGGEIGIHGYNHQPLTVDNLSTDLNYRPWVSEDAITQALRFTEECAKKAYPNYSFRVYIPPSNIISPEGRRALLQAVPDIKIIASVYLPEADTDSYVQEFELSSDGVWEIPRVASGFLKDRYNDWSVFNAINSVGIYTHFIHPDDIMDDQRSEGKTWSLLYDEFTTVLEDFYQRYPWLRSGAMSSGIQYLEDYLLSEYAYEEDKDSIHMRVSGFKEHVFFILKTNRKITKTKGCEFRLIDDNSYLLQVNDTDVRIEYESSDT